MAIRYNSGLRSENQMLNRPFQSRGRLFGNRKRDETFCWFFLFC